MNESKVNISGFAVGVTQREAFIVGSGAAGLAAANCLYDLDMCDIGLITEHINNGTSRNTGSDKQTYYKLSLCGSTPDSIYKMAETLYAGGCMDGDVALAEAALSMESFTALAHMGVPFPKNRFGEYIGYKTDHDPAQRASSAGPLTSKFMTEALQREAERKRISIYSGWQVIRILYAGGKVDGLLCLRCDSIAVALEYHIFRAPNIIYATGGPAGIYQDSVYPRCQHGASGVAFLAGVKGRNLTEWQYGLASVCPRWNVSGSYMQVMPRVISTDQDGGGETEFLGACFSSREEALYRLFLKGYQWPFDVKKCKGGSSDIDLAVYRETVEKGRRVFLDFTRNPWDRDIGSWKLPLEAVEYLQSSDAYFGTPAQRLERMNAPAYDFYRNKGIDLFQAPLEISLCAQHNNGGIAVDLWWQTDLKGFFAVGEAAGTHGVFRPGGTALNAGQAGARRAAQYIAEKGERCMDGKLPQICVEQAKSAISRGLVLAKGSGEKTAEEWITIFRKKMSSVAGPVRYVDKIGELRQETEDLLGNFEQMVRPGKNGLRTVFLLEDMLISQRMYLASMSDYAVHGGTSRGSAVYAELSEPGKSDEIIPLENEIQEIYIDSKGQICCEWRKRHPIPEEDNFFEKVWKGYRQNKNIF